MCCDNCAVNAKVALQNVVYLKPDQVKLNAPPPLIPLSSTRESTREQKNVVYENLHCHYKWQIMELAKRSGADGLKTFSNTHWNLEFLRKKYIFYVFWLFMKGIKEKEKQLHTSLHDQWQAADLQALCCASLAIKYKSIVKMLRSKNWRRNCGRTCRTVEWLLWVCISAHNTSYEKKEIWVYMSIPKVEHVLKESVLFVGGRAG